MGSLIHALAQQIPRQKILTQQQVTHLTAQGQGSIYLNTKDQTDAETVVDADYVLIALAPCLAAQHMMFTPPLPAASLSQWHQTATWMAPHAKYVAVYPEALWKQQGLSGQAGSQVGPMGEIHDASTRNGHAALFGFLGIPATMRQKVSEQDLMAHCRAQLVRLFGSEGANPAHEFIKDWSADACTATEADWRNPAAFHGSASAITPDDSLWKNRIIGIASEWSPNYSGYLAGAIEAATIGINRMKSQLLKA